MFLELAVSIGGLELQAGEPADSAADDKGAFKETRNTYNIKFKLPHDPHDQDRKPLVPEIPSIGEELQAQAWKAAEELAAKDKGHPEDILQALRRCVYACRKYRNLCSVCAGAESHEKACERKGEGGGGE